MSEVERAFVLYVKVTRVQFSGYKENISVVNEINRVSKRAKGKPPLNTRGNCSIRRVGSRKFDGKRGLRRKF